VNAEKGNCGVLCKKKKKKSLKETDKPVVSKQISRKKKKREAANKQIGQRDSTLDIKHQCRRRINPFLLAPRSPLLPWARGVSV
jgi:hypothetical protein